MNVTIEDLEWVADWIGSPENTNPQVQRCNRVAALLRAEAQNLRNQSCTT